MFGVMGIGAGFINAAGCSGKAKKSSNELRFTGSTADPTIYQISCTGDITIESIKDGAKVKQMYSDLVDTQVAIQADANTEVVIKGDVTKFVNSPNYGGYYPGYTKITSLDLSANTALTYLGCSGCTGITALNLEANTALTYLACGGCTGITALDLAANTALTFLGCGGCIGITALDLAANTALTDLGCSDCTGLKEIRYPATNSDVSTEVANAITAATAADGTVYTDSQGAYYSTIADAATAKGWTIEQL